MTAAVRIPAGLRIAHLIESSGPGGAERIVAEMATALQRAGAANVVFLPEGHEPWLADQVRGSGIVVQPFRIVRPLSPASLRFLTARLRAHRVDIAHSHEFSMAVYGGWAARLAGVPHVVTMHGGRYYAGRWCRRVAMRASVALSARTIAVSSPLGDALSRDLLVRRSRIRVVANGVRGSAPSSLTLRDELRLSTSDTLIVAVGNLYAVKGHVDLVDALGHLSQRHPGLHMAIAGRGPLEDSLRARARDLGIGQCVHLLGLRSDVPAVLAAADLVVHPSHAEGMPLAVLEAMFAGRPIVATAVGEIPRALANGAAGVLVPPADAWALATAIDTLLCEPERARALGVSAARRAHAEYGVDRMVRRYAGIYRAVLRLRARRRSGFALPWYPALRRHGAH